MNTLPLLDQSTDELAFHETIDVLRNVAEQEGPSLIGYVEAIEDAGLLFTSDLEVVIDSNGNARIDDADDVFSSPLKDSVMGILGKIWPAMAEKVKAEPTAALLDAPSFMEFLPDDPQWQSNFSLMPFAMTQAEAQMVASYPKGILEKSNLFRAHFDGMARTTVFTNSTHRKTSDAYYFAADSHVSEIEVLVENLEAVCGLPENYWLDPTLIELARESQADHHQPDGLEAFWENLTRPDATPEVSAWLRSGHHNKTFRVPACDDRHLLVPVCEEPVPAYELTGLRALVVALNLRYLLTSVEHR